MRPARGGVTFGWGWKEGAQAEKTGWHWAVHLKQRLKSPPEPEHMGAWRAGQAKEILS